jgi:rare lipoprotein A
MTTVTFGSGSIRFVVLALAVSLAACRSSAPPQSSSPTFKPPPSSEGRYTLENDVPLIEPIDLAAIREVIPKVERRTQAGNKTPYVVNGRTYRVLQNEAGYSETGVASWYGRKFHGHLTANGEQYDMFQLSAAHTTLPIPSYIKVTNLDNGKSIVARVNDRGPFHPGRIVDMSYAGAVLLGYANTGTARVRVESIVPRDNVSQAAPSAPAVPTSPPITVRPIVDPVVSVEAVATERQLIEENKGAEYLQIGAFATENSARNLQSKLKTMTSMDVVIHSEAAANGGTLYKVRVGPLADDAAVKALQDSVAAANLGKPFKVRL